MGRAFLGFCIGCIFITYVTYYLRNGRLEDLKSAGKAVHCNETDCYWSSANLTEFGLFDNFTLNFFENENPEMETRNGDNHQEEIPLLAPLMGYPPISFGVVEKKANLFQQPDNGEENENDEEYDLERQNLPVLFSENENTGSGNEPDEISTAADHLPLVDNQRNASQPNANVSQAFRGLQTIEDFFTAPGNEPIDDSLSVDGHKSLLPKTPSGSQNQASLVPFPKPMPIGIPRPAEPDTGRRNPLLLPKRAFNDDDDDDESLFGDDSELGPGEPLREIPRPAPKPGNLPGHMAPRPPLGPPFGHNRGEPISFGPPKSGQPPRGSPRLPGDFDPPRPHLPSQSKYPPEFPPTGRQPPRGAMTPNFGDRGSRPNIPPTKPSGQIKLPPLQPRPQMPLPPKHLGTGFEDWITRDDDLFGEQNEPMLSIGSRPPIPGNPLLSGNRRLPQGSLGLQNQRPRDFNGGPSGVPQRPMVGAPQSPMGVNGPIGGHKIPMGRDSFGDFGDEYDDMMAFGPKPFSHQGIRAF